MRLNRWVRFAALLAAAVAAASAFAAGPDGAATTFDGASLSIVWAIPFAGLLLSLAVWPLVAPKFWHAHYGKVAACWVLVLLVPFAVAYGAGEAFHHVVHALLLEYIPFVVVLFALYTIAGGIALRGTLVGSPALNTGILALGGLARQRDGDDRRGDAADPAAAARQRGARASRARRRVLHHPGRQRRRRADSAR